MELETTGGQPTQQPGACQKQQHLSFYPWASAKLPPCWDNQALRVFQLGDDLFHKGHYSKVVSPLNCSPLRFTIQ